MAVSVAPFSTNLVNMDADKLDLQRNLDSTINSASLMLEYTGFLGVPNDMDDSDDLYLPTYLIPFISSNETILSSGNCVALSSFTCSSPNCNEDISSTYSVSFPRFSSSNVTRINLKTQGISIAEGAWKLNSPPLYMHDCEIPTLHYVTPAMCQIGLGLSGTAYQNFQTPNPIFSIYGHSSESLELFFRLNPSYIPDNDTGTSLPCDLDWKVKVNSISIGGSIISDSPMMFIFDIKIPTISLPTPYYYRVRELFFQMPTLLTCEDQSNRIALSCIDTSDSKNLSLAITLENGTQLIFPQLTYWFGETSVSTIDLRSHNSTFSGAEYIILGFQVLTHFYTVFQQHDDLSTTITLYPLSSSAITTQFNPHSPSSASGFNISEANNTLDPTLGPGNTADTASKEPQYQPEVSNTENSRNKLDFSVLSLVIGAFIIVLFCLFMIVILRKVRAWFGKEDIMERSKSTVELNESSHFVSNISNGINETNNDDDIDFSE